MVSSFVPELDGTPELGPDDNRLFQEMIGMLRRATELGQVDVLREVSLLSQYQSSLGRIYDRLILVLVYHPIPVRNMIPLVLAPSVAVSTGTYPC